MTAIALWRWPSCAPESHQQHARGHLRRQCRKFVRAGSDERRTQNQIFGRIPAQRQLRGHDQCRAGGAGLRRRVEYATGVGRKIAEHLIELRDRQLHRPILHPTRLIPPRRNPPTLSIAVNTGESGVTPMRSPVPFIAPSLPIVASALIRDDVPLSDIAPAAWNALGHSQPFLSHAYLSALHETGCASFETGWSPHYLTAWRDGALVGALPLYSKAHSYGEYVFDWGWRRLSPPRPPLLPQVGRRGSLHAGTRTRVLAGDAATRRELLVQAIASVRDGGHSSLHVLFLTPAEAAEGEALGMIPRGLQFH
jgi:hypothetical protein